MALKEMLTRWGALVEEAENGENCLFHLRHGKENGAPFDLVLLDGQMAGTHEMELAKMIEENLHLAGQIILMTRAGNHQGEMAGAKRAGIRHYLVKPIKQSELRKAIESSRSRGETLAGVQPEPPLISSDTAVQLHILLVEDSEENRLLIQNYLKKTTHRVDIAENGEIAVNKFKSGSYDLVLMDMQMPVMDGYTATRKIRMWEREMGGESRKHTPIVALTAFALQEEAKKSLEAGCDAHLTKPIKRATLLKVLSEYSPQSPSLAPNPAGGRI
jgi:two-component system sensor histidine kinase/response regulator